MQRLRFRWLLVAIVPGLAAVLPGCQDPLRHRNFDHIQVNASTQGEVARIIGEPSQKVENQWLYERPAKHLTALVDFDESGVVTRKQWIDGTNAVWEDSEPDTPGQSSHRRISTGSGRR